MEFSLKPLDPAMPEASPVWMFPFSESMYSFHGLSLFELGL